MKSIREMMKCDPDQIEESFGGVVGIQAINDIGTRGQANRRRRVDFEKSGIAVPGTQGSKPGSRQAPKDRPSYVKLYEDEDGTLGLARSENGELHMVVRDGGEETIFEVTDSAVSKLREMVV